MSDGIWNAGQNKEKTIQVRKDGHRALRVNLSSTGLENPGDASTYASVDPNSGPGTPSLDMGPHFILSPETPDESHTYGFEFVLVTSVFPAAERITIPGGGLTVTIWELIGNSLVADTAAPINPTWAKFDPLTGVQEFELYHSFDVNACALRFQISGSSDDAAGGSVMIYMREL
jgi:hypothetical protein